MNTLHRLRFAWAIFCLLNVVLWLLMHQPLHALASFIGAIAFYCGSPRLNTVVFLTGFVGLHALAIS